MSIDRLPADVTITEVSDQPTKKTLPLTGPRYKNERHRRDEQTITPLYRVRRQLTGPAYKNRRFRRVRPRVARFRSRR